MSKDSPPKNNDAEGVGTGGAATNAGLWYQALWVVLQAATARFQEVQQPPDGAATGIRLILEPHGGDLVLAGAATRRVIQLKISNEDTWSLKDVVVDVLPDLYRAVELGSPVDAKFEFVTEARQGQWEPADRLFGLLGKILPRTASDAEMRDAYERLDNGNPLRFGGCGGPFWRRHKQTARGLLDTIVDHLRTLPVAAAEPVENVRRKLWYLLSRFAFSGGHTEANVRRDVDDLLLAVVERRERVANLRNEMVGWLVERSRRNDTTVTARELFDRAGLARVVPVSDRARVRARCEGEVRRAVAARGYRAEWDVRRDGNGRPAPEPLRVVVAVAGASGDGKSWRLYDEVLGARTMALAVLDSKGDVERDLRRAADLVWQSALGHDESLTLEGLSRRMADVLGPTRGDPWLTICLDRLADPAAVPELLSAPLVEWGVRLLVGCEPAVAEAFRRHRENETPALEVLEVGQFSVRERDEYLRRRLGEGWVHVPGDVREMLRKPQLAQLYCELAAEQVGAGAGPAAWRPRNEYELVERYWGRLSSGECAAHPKDALRVRRLAGGVLDGAPYPWDEEQLDKSGLDDEAIGRLIRRGWLIREEGRYRVPHDRLLNFGVAQELVGRSRSGSVDPATLADLIAPLLSGEGLTPRVPLGYVPMDWFYLALRDELTRPLAGELLVLLQDRLQHADRGTLDRHLLPTLEAASVPLLEERLVAVAVAGKWHEVGPVIDGLATRPAPELRDRVLRLLSHESPRVRRAAMRLLRRKPVAEALDVAWELHQRMQADPGPFLGDENTHPDVQRHRLYEDSFGALKACVRLSPDWLPAAVRRADPTAEPVHDLGYLIASLEDGTDVWRACKAELFEKVPSGKRRALALNAGTWRDAGEAGRLEAWAHVERDHLGPAAVRALARIDPQRAAAALQHVPEPLFELCRGWYLPHLFLTDAADATRMALYARIRAARDPLDAALVYQGYENEMDGPTLSLLLDLLSDALARALAVAPAGGDPARGTEAAAERHRDSLFRPLTLLAAVGRADLLDVFAARAGTELEDRLTRFLTDVIGPRRSLSRDNLSREPGIAVLLKIGGPGHRIAIGSFLRADSQYGKLDAIQEAVADADQHVLAQLRSVGVSPELWDGQHPMLQMEAMRALAAHGDGSGLVQAFLHLGQAPQDVDQWLRPGTQAAPEAVREVIVAVRERTPARLHGALVAVGVLRLRDAEGDVLQVSANPPDQQARVLAIFALGGLGSPATATVNLVAHHLQDERCRLVAEQALSKLGTPGVRRLLQSLDGRWDTRLAVWLASHPETKVDATDRLARYLDATPAGQRNLGWRDDTSTVLAGGTEEVVRQVMQRCPAFHDRVREAAFAGEGTFWVVGSKADAIRGLATVDPEAARLAAARALSNPTGRDRHLYPVQLYRSDRQAARGHFIALAGEEKDESVVWAMAHALEAEDGTWLLDQLRAEPASRRVAGCRLAARLANLVPEVGVAIKGLLNDRVERVARAAIEALGAAERHARASGLADRVAAGAELSSGHVWRLAEATLHVGDVGYQGVAGPTWQRQIYESDAFRRYPGLDMMFSKALGSARRKALEQVRRAAR